MENLHTDTFAFSEYLSGSAPWLDSVAPPRTAGRVPCDGCGARRLCQAAQLCRGGQERPVSLPVCSRKVSAGEAVYRAGDPLRNLYTSRAGTCKSIRLYRDGRQQITGFHLNGEFLGLDAIATGRHETDAVALEDMVVCVLPYREIEALSDEHADVRRGMQRMLSREIVREAGLLMLMGNLSAEERVAAFLVDLADRYAERGYSPVAFTLRMSREEIGSHLGMKLETVSRMFSRLQQRGLIALHGKEVRILDLPALRLA
ncbi:helix-turn-helix domain-containing protein [Bordetella genomosp. 11]|uniref:HTH crp-type domain-containing protein n=1 Tax=Bordetella genomosp. 11 TaxID=1416808 RepID=A0A261UG77_9BORD|nr:helix-turn-helix domain-containing protein [Bordetella genomosp. 11]OZI60914.1 hypothetical protein CAL28_16245 [Bordetella genomosp. 11]